MDNRQDQLNRLEELRWQLVDIERQQEDDTLSHSDQQLLDQAWEDITNEIDELEEIIATGEEIEAEWRDATEYLEDEDDDEEEFVRSHTVPARIAVRKGKVMFAPPPPEVHLTAEQVARAEKELAEACWIPLPGDEGCARCSGCTYCSSSAAYDGADEI